MTNTSIWSIHKRIVNVKCIVDIKPINSKYNITFNKAVYATDKPIFEFTIPYTENLLNEINDIIDINTCEEITIKIINK